MLDYFYYVVGGYLNEFLPQRISYVHPTEKPWVNEYFRSLIRSRQYAWQHNDLPKYRSLQNRVQRTAKKLRSKYYDKQVHHLRNSQPGKWWREVKQFTGQMQTSPLLPIAANKYNGDSRQLAKDINDFFAVYQKT
jgi:hypothetical protein